MGKNEQAAKNIVRRITLEQLKQAYQQGPSSLREMCAKAVAQEIGNWPQDTICEIADGVPMSMAYATIVGQMTKASLDMIHREHGPVPHPRLPEKPYSWNVTVGDPYGEPSPSFDCPSKVPRSAAMLVVFEIDHGPGYQEGIIYRISSNKKRTHWILWYGYEDPQSFNPTFIFVPAAWCSSGKSKKSEAAVLLLIDHWEFMKQEHDHDFSTGYHVIATGLITQDILSAIFSRIWLTS